MCIDMVSLPNVQYHDMVIYRYIAASLIRTYVGSIHVYIRKSHSISQYL